MKPLSPFVETEWLFERLSQPDVCIVDASWHLPNVDRDAHMEYRAAHIPGAVYFDLDKIADTSTDLPHMVASPEDFSQMVGDLGIRESNTIIVYDSYGLFTAARVWWNFRIMGAQNSFVLRGGLPKWLAEGRPVTDKPALPARRPFATKFQSDQIVSSAEVEAAITRPQDDPSQIVDMRPNLRFAGLEGEPRPNLRSGHMPQSVNLPFPDLVDEWGLLDEADILARMKAAGIDPEKPIIASCGSGASAPMLCLALAEMGIDTMRVYDGSWAEWGAPGSFPVLGADGKLVRST